MPLGDGMLSGSIEMKASVVFHDVDVRESGRGAASPQHLFGLLLFLLPRFPANNRTRDGVKT